MKNQRFIKNIFIRPAKQLKLITFIILSSYALVLFAFLGAQVSNYFAIKSSLSYQAIEPALYEHILNSLLRSMIYPTVLCLFLILVSFLALVKISHNFFGPIVPICAILHQLIEGNYGQTRNLRKNDELTEIMDAVNILSKTLERRNDTK